VIFLFWICFGCVIYVYFGYPLLLASGFLGARKPIQRRDQLPFISILVPAYNEERIIQKKLDNLLAQDYPKDCFEILVGNDGSTDDTERIVRDAGNSAVKLVTSHDRLGKSAIQNQLVARSSGSVLVFTDADCLLPPGALRMLVRNFGDPEVGLVTNCAVIVNSDETGVVKSEGLYWKYERWLRTEESNRRLLAMASGSLFAMRRDLWRALDPNVGDDFVLPLHVARAGYRNVLEPGVCAQMRITQNQPQSLLRMKVRIISKDLRGLLQNAACLNPLQTGTVAVSLWSHKLLRWAVPYFLIGLFVSSVLLSGGRGYWMFAVAQASFYAIAVVGLLFGARRFRFPWSVVSSFCLVNFAALLGTLHCLSLRTAGQWKTVR
jgi:cellulose synthase/poly-beta-1,6-N-acetylglucosamine synthase-like glycosyltransferase